MEKWPSPAQQCKILFLGFDMAIHMCYRTQIMTGFLAPLTNDRTDEYGGSPEKPRPLLPHDPEEDP